MTIDKNNRFMIASHRMLHGLSLGHRRHTISALRTRSPVSASARPIFKVTLEHEGKTHVLDVPEGETVLNVAVEKYKLNLPHGK